MAQDALKAKGITYPAFNLFQSVEAHFIAVNEYGMKEAELYQKFLKEEPVARPIVNPVAMNFNKPYKDWMDD